jgi:hypothetical protein
VTPFRHFFVSVTSKGGTRWHTSKHRYFSSLRFTRRASSSFSKTTSGGLPSLRPFNRHRQEFADGPGGEILAMFGDGSRHAIVGRINRVIKIVQEFLFARQTARASGRILSISVSEPLQVITRLLQEALSVLVRKILSCVRKQKSRIVCSWLQTGHRMILRVIVCISGPIRVAYL